MAIGAFVSNTCFSSNTDYLTKRWHGFITGSITKDTYTEARSALDVLIDKFYVFMGEYGEQYTSAEDVERINDILIHLVSVAGLDFELLDDLFVAHDQHGYTMSLIETVGELSDAALVQSVYKFLPCHRVIEAIKTTPHLNGVDFKKYIPQIPRIVQQALDEKETLGGSMDMAFFSIIYARSKLWDATGSLSDGDIVCLSYLKALCLLDAEMLNRAHTDMLDRESLAIIDLLYQDICAARFEFKGLDTYLETCKSIGVMPSFEQWCNTFKGNEPSLVKDEIDYSFRHEGV